MAGEEFTEPPREDIIDVLRQEMEEAEAAKAKAQQEAAPFAQKPGRVVVWGTEWMRGCTITLHAHKLFGQRLHASLGEQSINGRTAYAAYFPTVEPGTYNIHASTQFTILTVFAGELTEVFWGL